MDFADLMSLVTTLSQGGPAAIITLLIMTVAYLHRDNVKLKSILAEKDKRTEAIVDKYYSGNLSLADALNSLKATLFELKSRF